MHLRSGRSLAAIFLAAALTLHATAATEDPSAQWEQKVQAAERLLATGRPAQAESLLREALEIARSSEGTNGRLEDTLGLLAVSLLQQDKLDEAEEVFEELLVLREASEGLEDRALFAQRRELARAFRLAGRPEIAEGLFRRALERTAARLGPGHPMVAALWIDLGNFLQELGRKEEAEQAQRQALRLREEYFGPEHPRVADSYYNLGIALAARDKFVEAEEAYRRSLAIEEKRLGPDDPSLGRIVNNLAGVLDDLGRHAEALTLRRRTLQLWEGAYGPNAPLVGMALSNLARTLRLLDRDEEAEKPLRRALWTFEKAFGTDALELASPMTSLAAVLIAGPKRLAEAEALAERALKIQEQYPALMEPDRVAETLRILSSIRHRQKRPREAEVLNLQVLEIYEKAHGPESYAAGLGAWDLAEFYLFENQDGMAAPMYERALRLLEATRGPDHPDLIKLWSSAAYFYDKYGQSDKAEQLYRRAVDVSERRLGADHPRTAAVVMGYASMLRRRGREEEADQLLSRKATAAAEHAAAAETAEARWRGAMEAAGIAEFAKQYKAAEEFYARALRETESFERLDPRRTQTMGKAAGILVQQSKYAEAEQLLREAVALQERVGGDSILELTFYLDELGKVYVAREGPAEAFAVFERALALLEQELGPQDPRLGQTLNKLAYLSRLQGSPRDSESYAVRAVQVLENDPEQEEHLEAALRHLGEQYLEEERYRDAEGVYRRILERREKKYGWDHEITGAAVPSLAEALRRAGRSEEADALEARRKGILRRPTRPPAVPVSPAEQAKKEIKELNQDAQLLASRGKYEEAERLFQRGLELVEETPGVDDPQIEFLYNNYSMMLRRAGRQEGAKQIDARALAYFESVAAAAGSPEARWNAATAAGAKAGMLGRWEDAERLYRQAVEAAELLGPQDKRMVRSLNSLAGAYRVQKKDAEAEAALRRALSILESAAEPDKTQIGAMLASLAGLVSSYGRLEEAEQLLRRSVELYEASLGPEHPMLMGPLQGLADVTRKLGRNEEADALAARAEQVRANSQKQ